MLTARGEGAPSLPGPSMIEGRKQESMTKYPFKEKVDEYLEVVRVTMADSSFQVLSRRFRRMERDMIQLYEAKEIKTLAPKKMDEDDVLAYLRYRKGRKVGPSDYNHDISALRQLLRYNDNNAVDRCLVRNPGMKQRAKQKRLDPLPEDTYRRILAVYRDIDQYDFRMSRAFTLVLMYIGTGARNKELRLARIGDLDTDRWEIRFEHVKGEDTYGEPRSVPVPGELQPIVLNYLIVRDAWLRSHKAQSDALFFAMNGKYSFLSGNSIRKIKRIVEDAVGETFELRDCRRAFGQIYLNKGVEVENVSVLMGHDTTKTTELYYCRKGEDRAIEAAKEVW